MGLRLKYDGIACCFTTDMHKRLSYLVKHGTGNVYVIVNYTGLYKTNALLHELSGKDVSGGTISNAGDAKVEVLNKSLDEKGIEEFCSTVHSNVDHSSFSKSEDCVNVTHLYPDLLNLYGDRGNIQSLRMRLE